MQRTIENLRIGAYAMRYSLFVPRLYNHCRSLGFERSRMMPSRAFCSDESQGYPVMLIAQHFGTFPFDHGRVGGKVAINRHGPYAHHGEDLVTSRPPMSATMPTLAASASTGASARKAAPSATIAASSARSCTGTARNIATPASRSAAAG